MGDELLQAWAAERGAAPSSVLTDHHSRKWGVCKAETRIDKATNQSVENLVKRVYRNLTLRFPQERRSLFANLVLKVTALTDGCPHHQRARVTNVPASPTCPRRFSA